MEKKLSLYSSDLLHILGVLGVSLGFLLIIKLGIPLSNSFQIIFLTMGILFGGIPHGAVDHLIQEKEFALKGKKFNFIVFYILYISVMSLYALAWFFFPIPSLIFFIGITAWHFGETDLFRSHYSKKWIRFVIYFSYGLWVILFLLISHFKEVEILLNSLNLNKLNSYLSQLLGLRDQLLYYFTGSILLFWLIDYYLQKKANLILLLQICLIISLSFLPLLIAFTLYFTGWHSLRSLNEIAGFLKTKSLRLNFLKLTIPNTLIAFLVLGGLYYFWTKFYPIGSFVLLIFILLSLLTLPHFLIMHTLFSKREKEYQANLS